MPSEIHDLLIDNDQGSPTLILAHGAGAPMDSDFMQAVTERLATAGVCVVRFEVPYMAGRRVDGKKRGPNSAKVLEATWREVIAQVCDARDLTAAQIVIGGKSMGGRIASMIADDTDVAGLVCLGYPFHPTGKPEKLRTEHLEAITTPSLCLQGTRDPFGKLEEVEGYTLSEHFQVTWLEDGDHSFKPRKRSGRTLEQNLDEACGAILTFLEKRTPLDRAVS